MYGWMGKYDEKNFVYVYIQRSESHEGQIGEKEAVVTPYCT